MPPSRPPVDTATAIVGAALGVAVALGGYAITFVTAVDAARVAVRAFEPLAAAGGRFAPDWKLAVWLFEDAHLVGTRFAGRTVDLVSFASVEFLYLVPPLLLAVAGAVTAVAVDADSRRDGAMAGLTVALGYVLVVGFLALVGQYADVRSSLLRAVVVAGVVYPVAFGALGGYLAAVVRDDRP